VRIATSKNASSLEKKLKPNNIEKSIDFKARSVGMRLTSNAPQKKKKKKKKKEKSPLFKLTIVAVLQS